MVKSTKKIRNIYLDYASSALISSANSGAIHDLGVKEKNKLDEARSIFARILYAHKDEIVFTSGATESNNLAILGLVRNFKNPHIVTTNIEHASVLEVFKYLEETKQAEVTFVEVEPNGIVDIKKIKKALKKNTILVSVMYANNEIGTIQPIIDIAKEIRHYQKNKPDLTRLRHPLRNSERAGERCILPFFHTDATQAINYLPINVAKLGVDLLSCNSAKIYGPKGVGLLYVKRDTPLKKIMFGGDQEFGLRPGTENVSLVVAFAKAFENTEKIKEQENKRLTKLRDYFLAQILNLKNQRQDFRAGLAPNRGPEKILVFDFFLNGDLKNRLPNNINITIPKIPSDLLVIELSAKGVMASAKSACKSGDGKASHVIKAINPKALDTDGSLRFSLGRQTNKKDIDDTIKILFQILTKLKKWYS